MSLDRKAKQFVLHLVKNREWSLPLKSRQLGYLVVALESRYPKKFGPVRHKEVARRILQCISEQQGLEVEQWVVRLEALVNRHNILLEDVAETMREILRRIETGQGLLSCGLLNEKDHFVISGD